jgi:hypothetical protein
MWTLQLVNYDATYHKVFLVANIGYTSIGTNTVNNSALLINNSAASTSLNWTPNWNSSATSNNGFTITATGIGGDVQVNQIPDPAGSCGSYCISTLTAPYNTKLSPTQSVNCTSVGFCVLAPGQVVIVPVTLNLTYAPGSQPGYYTVQFNPNSQSYP